MNAERAATVLVIDDEELVCVFAAAALQREGYAVITANSAQNGLRVFTERQGDIDLVISDVVMPDMSGYKVVEAMRRIRPDLPVILMTGAVESAPDWVKHSCGLLLKPFALHELLRAVEILLKDR